MANAEAAKGGSKPRIVERVVEKVVPGDNAEAIEAEKQRIKEVGFLHYLLAFSAHYCNNSAVFIIKLACFTGI